MLTERANKMLALRNRCGHAGWTHLPLSHSGLWATLATSVLFRSMGQTRKPLFYSGLWARFTSLCCIQVCGPDSQSPVYSGLWARFTSLCCIQVCRPDSQSPVYSGLWARFTSLCCIQVCGPALRTSVAFRSVGRTHKPLLHSGLWDRLQILAEHTLCNRYTDYNIMPQSSLPKTTTNQTKTATESTPRHQFYRRSRNVFFDKSHFILPFIASTSCSHLPLPGS